MFPDLKYLSPKLNLHHLSVHYFEFILFYGFSLPCWFNFFKAWISWTDRTISWQVYISELAFKLNVKLILPLHALLIVGVFLQSAFQTANMTTLTDVRCDQLEINTPSVCVGCAYNCMYGSSASDWSSNNSPCLLFSSFSSICVVICKHAFFVKIIINNIPLRGCSVILPLPRFGMTV